MFLRYVRYLICVNTVIFFFSVDFTKMPISEDEIDNNRSKEPQTTMSKAEIRKTHKPIMEKRRRARINHCLNEIKTLILEAMNKDVSTQGLIFDIRY